MASAFLRSKVCAACVALMAVAACGGGSGGGGGGSFFPIGGTPAPTDPAGPSDPTPQEPADAGFAVKVMDGAIRNAVVFLDKNNNGLLDTDEPSARTDAEGNATLQIAPADRGTAPVVALIGTDAVDAQSGPVTTAYVLKAPADKAQLVTPFTTLINQIVENTGATTEQAETNLRLQLGLSKNLLEDYSADNANSAMASTFVKVAQKISTTATGQVLTPDGFEGLTAADISKETQNLLIERLPTFGFHFSTQFARTSCADGLASDACKDFITFIADLFTGSPSENRLQGSNMSMAVGTTRAIAAVPPASRPETPEAGGTLEFLTLTNNTNWYRRILLSTTEEATPINGKTRFRDFRNRSTNGTLTSWSSGGSPDQQDDLHWNGSAWVTCPIGVEATGTSTARDARQVSSSDYCDGASLGVSKRTPVDISGHPMAATLMYIQAYPYSTNGAYGQRYSNWGPNLSASEWITLAPFTFPAGSTLYYQGALDLSNAPTYSASNASKVTVSSAEVAAGGDSRTNPAVPCSVSTTPFAAASSLDEIIARNPGTACFNGPANLAGTALSSGARNDGWQATSLSLGSVGGAPLGDAATVTDYYTTNRPIRVSFTGGNSSKVTFYECQQRAINGSARNCDVVGSGNYTITQMGDARVMSFGAIPGLAAYLGSERVLIERGGAVFIGNKAKPVARKQIRMNLKAANAIFEAFTTLGYVGLTQITP